MDGLLDDADAAWQQLSFAAAYVVALANGPRRWLVKPNVALEASKESLYISGPSSKPVQQPISSPSAPANRCFPEKGVSVKWSPKLLGHCQTWLFPRRERRAGVVSLAPEAGQSVAQVAQDSVNSKTELLCGFSGALLPISWGRRIWQCQWQCL